MGDADLARYQASLLDVLARTDLGDEARAALLRQREQHGPYAAYVDGMETRFVALGAELMRRWGRRA
jgi:hypothetical protein